MTLSTFSINRGETRKSVRRTSYFYREDTTLELPATYEYIGQFKAENPKIHFFIPRPDLDFYELSRQLGPPSRIKRWCCTIFKTAPLSTVLNTVNEESGVLGDFRKRLYPL